MLKSRKKIFTANARDLRNFSKTDPLYDRLMLNEERMGEMVMSLKAVVKLDDPVGEVLERRRMANGLQISRVRVPFGVVGVIYESRPNVTIEIASLCLKTGNAVILRGSKDAFYTNSIFISLIHTALEKAGLPVAAVFLVPPHNRALVGEMLSLDRLIDVIIPRGSNRLIKFVRENAVVPVIETGAGVCHTYVEKSADLVRAALIVHNAKVQRPSVCNALDTVVIDGSVLKVFFSHAAPLLSASGVEIRADQKSYQVLSKIYPSRLLCRAKQSDFGKEFMSLCMSVKTVRDYREAIAFIQNHTSGHSEAILTKNKAISELFLASIDAACVYANASTRFTDGFQFGLGAEVGISTQKLHARGPMALRELTTYKWLVRGTGQIRP